MKLLQASGPRLLVAALGPLALIAPASSQAVPQHPTVSLTEQARLDSDRMRILQQELDREQARVDEAARQRAERLASGDHTGHRTADEAHGRALANVAAIRRELEAARSATPTPKRAPVAHRSPAPLAWWDVYARRPRVTAADTP